MHGHGGESSLDLDLIVALPFAAALALYAGGVLVQRSHGRTWPWWRTTLWTAGVIAAASGFAGPLAIAAHDDFVSHMLAHLLVGMVAPLLLVLAAPVTLALRSLPLVQARRLAGLLRNKVVAVIGSPVVAALLNVGGLWLLYVTPLFELMQSNALVHLAVMTHLLLAGFLFTAAIAPVDPSPHRATMPLRIAVLIAALAAHGILAKALYASPPAGVSGAEAHAGAQLMFYGGDLVDASLLTLLFWQWYRAGGASTQPRRIEVEHRCRGTRTSDPRRPPASDSDLGFPTSIGSRLVAIKRRAACECRIETVQARASEAPAFRVSETHSSRVCPLPRASPRRPPDARLRWLASRAAQLRPSRRSVRWSSPDDLAFEPPLGRSGAIRRLACRELADLHERNHEH